MMNIVKLDNFSDTFSAQLFERFPEWRELAKVESSEDGTGYLKLEVAAPTGANVASGLTLTTDNSELTIGFDYYHAHYFEQVGDGVHFGTDYALYFLSQLLSEKVSVVSWWLGSDWVAFSTIEEGKPLMDDSLIGAYDHVRIRSWKGTLNEDTTSHT